jgi:hypothetical protein
MSALTAAMACSEASLAIRKSLNGALKSVAAKGQGPKQFIAEFRRQPNDSGPIIDAQRPENHFQ